MASRVINSPRRERSAARTIAGWGWSFKGNAVLPQLSKAFVEYIGAEPRSVLTLGGHGSLVQQIL
jgi:hypothetical protein